MAKGMRYATIALNLFPLTVRQYIETCTRRRSRDPAENDLVYKIDDVRNGILLNAISHRNSGRNVAFLIVRHASMLLDQSLMLISRHPTLP